MASSDDTLEAQALALVEEALDRLSPERPDWIRKAAGSNDALRDRALSLLAFHATDGGIRTGQAAQDSDDEAPAPKTIGAYHITGIIGQGGMGIVYRGERMSGDFEHDVAIKVIKRKVLSDGLIERFARERQTLASLSHRHIARLYDGGTTPDGAPYIIMEYIDGVPITDWCAAQGLSLARRLALFCDGCDAVAYAHRNLVIHRDITPSNMLLTPEGEVKLIDFGIAKPFSDEADAETLTASIPSLSFTPGYAAPERRRGSVANTLSDIYSLGRLLEAMVPEAMRSADLKAIIAKAAATDPAQRYATVDALSADIALMQDGHPVTARPATAGYRFGKFFRRHKAAVSIGTLAFAGLAAAFGISFTQYLRAESALESANARFAQSRELARTMVFDIYDKIAQIGGTLEVRKELVDVLETYVDELAEDQYAPDDILMDVAIQYNRLSDLYGGIGISNLGEAETSYDLLLRAEGVLDTLLARDPDNVNFIDELVWTLRLMTNQELVYNLDVDAARRANDKALALAERGMALPGADETPIANRFWNARTDRLKILSYGEEQQKAVEEVRVYRAELAAPFWEETLNDYDRKAAYFASQEGELLYELLRYEEALPPLREALEIFEARVAEAPENYYYLVQAMRLSGLVSPAARRVGNLPESLAAAARAVDLAERIRALDPEDANGDQYLASQLERLGLSQAAAGQAAAAEATIGNAIALRRGVFERFPDIPSYRRDLALTYKEAGIIYGELGREEIQCDYLGDALAIMTELERAGTLTDYDTGARMEEIRLLIDEGGCAA